ncbi:MAG TPA: lyase, partial [Sutterella sp.]|nr:lyase [Sutterella sp.]
VLGTGIGQMPGYNEAVFENLSRVVGFPMHRAKMDGEVIEDSALFDGSANNDGLMILTSVLKALACAGGKIGNDFYIFSSGPRTGIGELILPSIAPGSSIMPGKLNPYMPELLLQIMQQVSSHDHVATLTINESELDLCSSTCASFMGAMESLELIEKGFRLFTDLCLKDLKINREKARKNAEMSTANATIASALFGYPVGTRIAQTAYKERITCKEAALREGLVSPDVAEEIFDVAKLAHRKDTVAMLAKYGALRAID